MSITNSIITTELISDVAGGRLDAEDARVIQEAINHDEIICDSCRRCPSGQRASAAMAGNIDNRRLGFGRWPDTCSEALMIKCGEPKTKWMIVRPW